MFATASKLCFSESISWCGNSTPLKVKLLRCWDVDLGGVLACSFVEGNELFPFPLSGSVSGGGCCCFLFCCRYLARLFLNQTYKRGNEYLSSFNGFSISVSF